MAEFVKTHQFSSRAWLFATGITVGGMIALLATDIARTNAAFSEGARAQRVTQENTAPPQVRFFEAMARAPALDQETVTVEGDVQCLLDGCVMSSSKALIVGPDQGEAYRWDELTKECKPSCHVRLTGLFENTQPQPILRLYRAEYRP
jgi:hypothetical protein